jgi:hypothetical protein
MDKEKKDIIAEIIKLKNTQDDYTISDLQGIILALVNNDEEKTDTALEYIYDKISFNELKGLI